MSMENENRTTTPLGISVCEEINCDYKHKACNSEICAEQKEKWLKNQELHEMENLEIVKTCSTCSHYCSVLSDEDSNFHIHNYCKVWKAPIPDNYLADIEYSETDYNWNDGGPVIYDDIETNRAACWCWKEKR